MAAKPTYKLGFEGPLSGPNAQVGRTEVAAFKLAIEQANARGNLPFNLSWVTRDDLGDPAHAPGAATQLISNPSVLAVVGPAFSGTIEAAGPQYNHAGLGFVSPSATKPSLAAHHWRTFHRVVPSDTTEGQLAVNWLHRRGIKKLTVVVENASYGQIVGSAVVRQAKALHMRVSRLSASTSGTGYTALARKVAAAKPGAMFFAGYDTEAAKLAKALVTAKFKGLRVGGNGIFSSLFTRYSRSAGYGWYATCGCVSAYPSSAQKAFVSAYRAKWHTNPGLYSATAYDATNAAIRALTNAVAQGSHSRAAVNAALGRLNFFGVYTRVRFAPNGDIDSRDARVNLFRDQRSHFAQVGNIRTAH